ncbi:MAG: MipA/OmpV family protein [Rhodospirillaceae bacterium]|nr:MipA/OmpV family protein [Rhodospirillaceae bacterium]
MTRTLLRRCLLAAAVFAPLSVQAQSFERAATGLTDTLQNAVDLLPEGVNNIRLGLGPAIGTDYEGSDHYKVDPVPVVSLRYRDLIEVDNNEVKLIALKRLLQASAGTGGGTNLRAGPLVSFNFGRGEGDSPDLRGMGNVDLAFELGGFVSYYFNDNRSRVRLRARQDVAGGHSGALASIDYNQNFIRTAKYNLGGWVQGTWVSGAYMRSFFGVSPAQSLASGYPVYRPGNGFKDVTFGLNGNYTIAPQWSLVAAVSYKRLIGGAADSPIVDLVGSPNQMSYSTFIVYSF